MIQYAPFLSIVFLTTGTFAYFRRGATGNVNVNTGKLTLSINDKSAYKSETFEVVLTNADGSNLKPGDSGSFNLELDASGSSFDVSINLELSRTNLPDNLKFYLDSEYKNELVTYGVLIKKSNDMTKTVPVYWYWDGTKDDINDSLFINQSLSAIVNVSATIASKTLHSTLLSMDSTLDVNVNFNEPSVVLKGPGLMMRNGTQNNTYPIVYYRGDVDYNNIIYAGYCWLIVRTTETGGTKLIYNGEINDDGSCNNYSGVGTEDWTEGLSPKGAVDDEYGTTINREYYLFSTADSNVNSPVYVGYMYNDDKLYFENNILDSTGYITHLADKEIDGETGRHVQNLKDSNAKLVIDDWYEENIKDTNYENLLEDTIWCNDRSVTSSTYSIENYATNRLFEYGSYSFYNRELSVEPTLLCSRDVDKFTVFKENGNGDLSYPIGLLTLDEAVLSGYSYQEEELYIITYLGHYASEEPISLITPALYGRGFGYINSVDNSIHLNMSIVNLDLLTIRPSVSLNNSTYLISGDGSFANPYIVG